MRAQGKSYRSIAFIHHTASGEPFSHTLVIEPLRSQDGGMQCMQASFTNIRQLSPEAIMRAGQQTAADLI